MNIWDYFYKLFADFWVAGVFCILYVSILYRFYYWAEGDGGGGLFGFRRGTSLFYIISVKCQFANLVNFVVFGSYSSFAYLYSAKRLFFTFVLYSWDVAALISDGLRCAELRMLPWPSFIMKVLKGTLRVLFWRIKFYILLIEFY